MSIDDNNLNWHQYVTVVMTATPNKLILYQYKLTGKQENFSPALRILQVDMIGRCILNVEQM
jgi:hypothetical protein